MRRGVQALVVLVVLLLAAAPARGEPTFYGYIKLDASYDSAKTDDGNFAYIVLPYAADEEDDEFNMTARQTRLGVRFAGPGSDAVDVSGRIEAGFYGGGGENKPTPMLRHAYFELKTRAVDVLAGQTSDLVSPLVPNTLNYIVLWKSGDIGYRRPQIRLSKALEIADDTSLEVAACAARSMGRGGDGETFGMPSFQGRLAVVTELMGGRPMELGLSGLVGHEETTYTDSLGQDTETFELDTTCIAVDLSFPLGDAVTLRGEYFRGSNLAQYLGGVGQGIAEVPVVGARNLKPVEIEASGWWGQLTVDPVESWQFNVGVGVDDPELPEGDTANSIERNSTYYGNVIWKVAPSASIGAEFAKLETEYVLEGGETESYENSRVQLSFVYDF